jgi:hypothetical protein
MRGRDRKQRSRMSRRVAYAATVVGEVPFLVWVPRPGFANQRVRGSKP